MCCFCSIFMGHWCTWAVTDLVLFDVLKQPSTQCVIGFTGQEAMYCLLEVVAMAPKQLAPHFIKHLDWLKVHPFVDRLSECCFCVISNWRGEDVAQLVVSDWHAADAGSVSWCHKGFFSQSQLSVQTLLRCPYTLVRNRMYLRLCAR